MGAPPGTVVLVRFPFSDLSQTKLRPAIVLADAGRGDHVLCPVTSRAYGDVRAVRVRADSFVAGGLRVESFARPGKLFTAHEALLVAAVGRLRRRTHARTVRAVVSLLSDAL